MSGCIATITATQQLSVSTPDAFSCSTAVLLGRAHSPMHNHCSCMHKKKTDLNHKNKLNVEVAQSVILAWRRPIPSEMVMLYGNKFHTIFQQWHLPSYSDSCIQWQTCKRSFGHQLVSKASWALVHVLVISKKIGYCFSAYRYPFSHLIWPLTVNITFSQCVYKWRLKKMTP